MVQDQTESYWNAVLFCMVSAPLFGLHNPFEFDEEAVCCFAWEWLCVCSAKVCRINALLSLAFYAAAELHANV